MIVWTLVATGLSFICILGLGLGDPKRMRASSETGQPASRPQRLALTALALFPGIVLALMGDAAAFLVWLGTCAVTGWFTSIWFNMPGRSNRRQGRRG